MTCNLYVTNLVCDATSAATAAQPGTATRLRGVLCPTLCVTDFPVKVGHPFIRIKKKGPAPSLLGELACLWRLG